MKKLQKFFITLMMALSPCFSILAANSIEPISNPIVSQKNSVVSPVVEKPQPELTIAPQTYNTSNPDNQTLTSQLQDLQRQNQALNQQVNQAIQQNKLQQAIAPAQPDPVVSAPITQTTTQASDTKNSMYYAMFFWTAVVLVFLLAVLMLFKYHQRKSLSLGKNIVSSPEVLIKKDAEKTTSPVITKTSNFSPKEAEKRIGLAVNIDAEYSESVAEDSKATKLDLVQAYIEMGDSVAAEKMLNAVISEGDPKYLKQAQNLLAQLGRKK